MPYITNGRAFSISIHAPRMGSDDGGRVWYRDYDYISIHAPRMGSDCASGATMCSTTSDFNPRSPHGERRYERNGLYGRNTRFQSTLPAWGATK